MTPGKLQHAKLFIDMGLADYIEKTNDPHTARAMRDNNLTDASGVTPAMRQRAKWLNYNFMYAEKGKIN